jgi:predicted nucleic acid-binding protein
MSDSSFFIDTNILVYANDSSEPAKQEAAIMVVTDGIREGTAVISTQVLSEFWVTVTRRIRVPLDFKTAERQLYHMKAFRVIGIEYDTIKAAVHLQRRFEISYWDALILAAAKVAGCRRIFSEDLNPEQEFDGTLVINPFAEVP